MKVKILGCFGGQLPGKNNVGFLLNNELLIDAGTIGLSLDIKGQQKIKNILLSHAHLDHIGALPFFAVNVVSNKSNSIKIIGSKETIYAVKKHLLNGFVWPDFTKIKNAKRKPVFEYKIIPHNKWIKIDKYKIMSIPVNHSIPTNGFLIGDGDKYILYSGDTKETEKIWNEANKLGKKLRVAFIETAFPNNLNSLAEASYHLVPRTLYLQLKKLKNKNLKIFVYHIKPEYFSKVKSEIKKIKGYKINIIEERKSYII